MINIKKANILLSSYLFVICLLFFYSYTQVDLSLTLSRVSIYQIIEKFFQHIGYFQRPLSTVIYSILVILLFVFYLVFLKFYDIIFSHRNIWVLALATGFILGFSYNAFSYDLFNYIFDAKVITHYHQNPYLYKALDYPRDPMLSFMHSVHRVYPYGPFWLLLTIPVSFLGANIFIITFYLFKLLSVVSYIGIIYYLGKIFKIIDIKRINFGIIFFAFNPLVLIEGLVSSHNDIVMAFFAIASLYFLIKRKNAISFSLLIFSIGIKYGSVLLLPLFLIFVLTKKISVKFLVNFSLILMVFSVAIISFASGQNKNSEIQPWYFLNLLPFGAFSDKRLLATIMSFFISLGMLTTYIPFLLNGIWPKDIVELKIIILTVSIFLGIIFYSSFKFAKNK